MMADEETRLDTTMCIGKEMHYKYTLVNFSENDLDKMALKNDLTEKMVKNFCNNDDVVKMLKAGVEYYYNYFDKDGISIITIHFSKENCGL
jgi:hypothetical protein